MSKMRSLAFGAGILILSPMVEADTGWTDYSPVAELVPTARH